MVIECECILATHMQRGIFYKHSLKLQTSRLQLRCGFVYSVSEKQLESNWCICLQQKQANYISIILFIVCVIKIYAAAGKVNYSQTKE